MPMRKYLIQKFATTRDFVNEPGQSEEAKAPQNAEHVASTSSASTSRASTSSASTSTFTDEPETGTEENDDNNLPSQSKRYKSNNYKSEWENSFLWIQASAKGDQFAYCKLCEVDFQLTRGISSLRGHAANKKHNDVLNNFDTAKKSLLKERPTEVARRRMVAEAEIKLSLFLAQNYFAFNHIEQVQSLVENICSDSIVAKNVQYNQTEASAILRHVTGALYFQDLCSLMKRNKFSVIIDASTDGLKTNVCVVVRLSNDFKITDSVYTLFTLEQVDAKAIYDNLVTSFNNNGVDYKTNLIGFCAKEADNVMMGVNSSVLSYLKTDIPDLFVMKCICHFSYECAAKACSKLPQNIEDFFRDVINYIKINRERIPNEFQAIFDVQSNAVFYSSQARLLSRLEVVMFFLDKYESLKAYLRTTRNLVSTNIYEKLDDPVHYLYLCFLSHGLTFFTKLNACMQSENPKIQTMYNEIETCLKSLLRCYLQSSYIKNINNISNIDYIDPRNHLPYEEIIVGTKVNGLLRNDSFSFEPDVLQDFRLHCLEFYVEGTKQMFTRFNLINYRFLKEIEILSPRNIEHEPVQSIYSLIAHFSYLVNVDSFQQIDNEWRDLVSFIRTVNKIPEEMEEFWGMVGRLELEPTYPLLTKFVFEVLSLPYSSAKAERSLYKVNLIKSVVKNNLETDLIVGILYSNDLMKNQSCFQFEITAALLDKYFKIQNQLQNQ